MKRRFEKYMETIRGTAAIEFAFVFPVLLLIIFGCIELGFVLWAQSALNYGATYAARYAYVHPTASASTIQNFALSTINFPDANLTYTVTGGGTSFEINGSYTYSFLIVPLGPVTLTVHLHQATHT